MSTTVIYNSVSISDCLTKVFRQEAVRDPSNTDIEYTKFTIRVFGLIHNVTANSDFGFQSLTGGDTVVSAEKRFREKLMQERQQFTMTVGGVTLLAALGTGSSSLRDVNNGPKPISIEVVKITGINAFHVEFEIEVCLVECESDTNSRGILGNRWQVEDSIDRDFRTTRTIRGRMRVKPGVDIHTLRSVVLPPLESNFQRESIQIVVNESGLEMQYTIVDRQYDQPIPFGATKWTGTHSQSTGKDGTLTHVHFAVDVWGTPSADKRKLFEIATKIVGTRITLNALSTSNNRLIESVELLDHMHESHVSFRLTVTDFKSFKETALGAPVRLDGQGAPTPLPYGDRPSIANLLVAQLQNPCSDDHDFSRGSTTALTANGGQRAGGGTSVLVQRGYLPDLIEPPKVSDSHKQALYTHCKVTQTHHRKAVHAAMPVARTSQNSSGSSSFLSGGGNSPSQFLQQSPRISNEQQLPTTVSVVQLGQPSHYRTIHFEMERIGIPPEIPFPEDFTEAGVAYVLIDSEDTPIAPKLMPDQKLVYSVMGKRTYIANAPPPLNQGFEAGSLPWDTTNTLSNRIPGSAYKRNIDH